MKTFFAAILVALVVITSAQATHPVHNGHSYNHYRGYGYRFGYQSFGVPAYSYGANYATSPVYAPSYAPSYYVIPQPQIVVQQAPVILQAPTPVIQQAPVVQQAPEPAPLPPVYIPPAPPASTVCQQELQQGYLSAPTVNYLGTLPAYDRYYYLHQHYNHNFANRQYNRHFGAIPQAFHNRLQAGRRR